MAYSGIIVVDDDPMVREILQRLLSEQGYEVRAAADGREAWGMILERGCEVLITDLDMPAMTGQELIAKVNEHSPATVIIVLTGHGSLDSAQEVIHSGCDEYLLKPIENMWEIAPMVKRSLERHRLIMSSTVGKRLNSAKSRMIHEIPNELSGPVHDMLNATNILIQSLTEKDNVRALSLAENLKKNAEAISLIVGRIAKNSERLKAIDAEQENDK